MKSIYWLLIVAVVVIGVIWYVKYKTTTITKNRFIKGTDNNKVFTDKGITCESYCKEQGGIGWSLEQYPKGSIYHPNYYCSCHYKAILNNNLTNNFSKDKNKSNMIEIVNKINDKKI